MITGSWPGSMPGRGTVTWVESVFWGQPGSSRPVTGSMAWMTPSASPNTIASRPMPWRSPSAGWASPPGPMYLGNPGSRVESWITDTARRSSPICPLASKTCTRRVTVY